jgi:chromate reductase
VRKDSVNSDLLRTARKISTDKFEFNSYENLANLPIFSQDLEGENIPDAAFELGKAVLETDAVLISTPEYNGSIPGGLNFSIGDHVRMGRVHSTARWLLLLGQVLVCTALLELLR